MCGQIERVMWAMGDRRTRAGRAKKQASCTMSMAMEISSNVAVADVVRRILASREIEQPVETDEDLREAGLTSLDMVSFVLSVEAEFGVKIPDPEITPANFRSIATIETLV